MLGKGFIMLHRSLLDWEWYSDIKTTRFFVHLLLTANYENKKWRGVLIKRGQRVSSLDELATETGLSKQSVRTAIKKLKSTGEITHEGTRQYSIFTVQKYDEFQSVTSVTAYEQHSNNIQSTTMKEIKEIKNNNSSKLFFEKIWAEYPNKRGKGRISDSKKKALEKIGYDTLSKCISRYIESKPEWMAYQNGSTFFNSGYIDYLDKDFLAETSPNEEKENYIHEASMNFENTKGVL